MLGTISSIVSAQKIATRRCAAILFILFAQTQLGSCGNIGICSNKCNPPLTHDSFCGCVDWSSQPPAPTSGNNTTATAACVCQYSTGVVGAWFPYQPSIYPKTSPDLTIFANGCSDLTVCELIKDDDSEHYTYLTGKITIRPLNWNKRTNLLNGSTVWTLFGNQVSKQGNNDNQTPIPSKYALKLYYKRLVQDANFESSPKSCKNACDVGSSSCLSVPLEYSQIQGLRSIRTILMQDDTTITSGALLKLFGVAEDPCHRSDTVLSHATVENKGDACTLRADRDIGGVTAKLDVPGVLAGDVARDVDEVIVSFPYEESRAKLTFSDADIEDDWGGDIRAVSANQNGVIFSVGKKSCVSVPFK